MPRGQALPAGHSCGAPEAQKYVAGHWAQRLTTNLVDVIAGSVTLATWLLALSKKEICAPFTREAYAVPELSSLR